MKLFAVAAALFALACGNGQREADAVRIGYFANVTHSQALIGTARGDFQRALGSVRPIVFNAGPSVIEALFAGQVDIAYVGPNPAVNGFVQSHGKALRIIAGATSGGASLVVRKAAQIRTPADLRGRRLASPQLGNTQDVALRRWLASHGLTAKDVEIVPTPNAQIFDLFRRGDVDGAWVPEPWASRLAVDGGGVMLVDERTLWPRGEFVTALVIVRTEFAQRHPQLVRSFVETHVDITRRELEHPAEARALVNAEIGRLTRKKLSDAVLASAWEHMRPTWDPLAPTLRASADAAFAAHMLRERPVLDGIFDVRFLNSALTARHLPEVTAR